MALGSCHGTACRSTVSPPTCTKLIAGVIRDLEIGTFFYIGGNDSMDTAHKLGVFFAEEGLTSKSWASQNHRQRPALHRSTPRLRFGGQIHRHLHPGDHPGHPGHLALPSVTIVEIMGRNAGWLTAASVLPHVVGEKGPSPGLPARGTL